MSKEAAVDAFLSCFTHMCLALVLLVYLPIAFVCRLLARPFVKYEDLRGKVVLVTGASSGIGEHLVYEYARKGACVALVARTEAILHAVAKKARELGTPDVLVVPADVTKVDEAKRAIEETITQFGKLNHLVANAGIWSSCLFEEVTNITAFRNVISRREIYELQHNAGDVNLKLEKLYEEVFDMNNFKYEKDEATIKVETIEMAINGLQKLMVTMSARVEDLKNKFDANK